MHVWRDIFPLETWQMVVAPALTSTKAARWGKNAGGTNKTAGQWLGELTALIKDYHDIKKTDAKQLTKRAERLEQISVKADSYLTFYCDSMNEHSRAAWETRVVNQRDHRGHFSDSDPTKELLQRNVLTLKRRSLRKRTYLLGLDKLCQKKDVRDYAKFLQLLISPPRTAKSPDLLGPQDNVLLEVIDPAHRSFEAYQGKMDFENETWRFGVESSGELGRHLILWYKTLHEHKKTFFLWLEGRPYCLGEKDRDTELDQSVAYVGDNVTGCKIPTLRLVARHPSHPGLVMTNYGSPHINLPPADTGAYTAADAKGPNHDGNRVAAFAWLEDSSILIGQHEEHAFHHTSFAAGNVVRCAGMIKITAGHVEWLSNNSGHYRPKQQHLAQFIKTLQFLGATTALDRVDCFGLKAPFEGTIGTFLLKHEEGALENA